MHLIMWHPSPLPSPPCPKYRACRPIQLQFTRSDLSCIWSCLIPSVTDQAGHWMCVHLTDYWQSKQYMLHKCNWWKLCIRLFLSTQTTLSSWWFGVIQGMQRKGSSFWHGSFTKKRLNMRIGNYSVCYRQLLRVFSIEFLSSDPE